jgi:hypothetical protein
MKKKGEILGRQARWAFFSGKSYTPLNAAQGARAAHSVAVLGRPIFCVFGLFCLFFICFVSIFSSFMFPFSAIIYIIIFLI